MLVTNCSPVPNLNGPQKAENPCYPMPVWLSDMCMGTPIYLTVLEQCGSPAGEACLETVRTGRKILY